MQVFDRCKKCYTPFNFQDAATANLGESKNEFCETCQKEINFKAILKIKSHKKK